MVVAGQRQTLSLWQDKGRPCGSGRTKAESLTYPRKKKNIASISDIDIYMLHPVLTDIDYQLDVWPFIRLTRGPCERREKKKKRNLERFTFHP